MNDTTTLYCGIDISCDTLDVCYQTNAGSIQHTKVSNDAKGFSQLLKQTCSTFHFVMEATGVYYISLMFFLHEHNCSYSVVNALQINAIYKCILNETKQIRKMQNAFASMAWKERLRLLLFLK